MTMKNAIIFLLVIAATGVCHAQDSSALEQRVAALEKEVAALKAAIAPVAEKARAGQRVAEQRNKARARMRRDLEVYSSDELREIEGLYQTANKQLGTQEATDSLNKLIEKYDRANRTGCALLYLGQSSKGKEREEYLKRAIADFSDCFYGDGVQVGAYARFYLAYHYKEEGEADKAKEMFDEIAKEYPDAIDHKGNFLADSMDD
jgi:TolA-binding protein